MKVRRYRAFRDSEDFSALFGVEVQQDSKSNDLSLALGESPQCRHHSLVDWKVRVVLMGGGAQGQLASSPAPPSPAIPVQVQSCVDDPGCRRRMGFDGVPSGKSSRVGLGQEVARLVGVPNCHDQRAETAVLRISIEDLKGVARHHTDITNKSYLPLTSPTIRAHPGMAGVRVCRTGQAGRAGIEASLCPPARRSTLSLGRTGN